MRPNPPGKQAHLPEVLGARGRGDGKVNEALESVTGALGQVDAGVEVMVEVFHEGKGRGGVGGGG